MSKKYRLYQVDSFTNELFRGNPAGVIPNADGLSDEQMQSIARELNNSETAFILKPAKNDHEVRIRFFTPTVEVPSCGHATIAAHYIRAIENDLHSCNVIQKIGIGILPVEIMRNEKEIKIMMTQGTVKFEDPLESGKVNNICDALHLNERDVHKGCPIRIVSTGHSKVMISLNDLNVLESLNPNFDALKKISKDINCNGYFVFKINSAESDILTSGRMFAPAIGINEDPVTGNANGPLGAYLVKHKLVDINRKMITFKGLQGVAIKRPGIVDVEVDVEDGQPLKVRIGGQARMVFKTEIEL